ncbi:hypothetical protein [Bifidobacterium saguinibicoloris]|uniref:hypothetical protein n=1 Tax=Bifidobacterium saguinibicoloris TaxID=2834433 RepID=UPI001C59C481|nr:hypothetical protein [Bifidobacterium saguinibicoloris]MBW3081489.1 hypothetical protein [Bifidobacterium saguinibicoloris]
MGGSMALAELTELKYRRMGICSELQRRTDWRPPYALSTALELMAIEMPRLPRARMRNERRGTAERVMVAVPHANRKYRVNGIDAVVWRFPMDTITIDRQFVCTSPACTWAMFAAYVELEELIVLADSMMRRDGRLRRTAKEGLALYLDDAERYVRQEREEGHACRMFKGFADCRRAMPMIREGTDSSMETRTRLALMRYGLDCPQVNYPVSVGHGGRTLYLDLAYPEFKICIEYDGAYHAGRWLGDVKRRQALEDAGWKYVQATSTDLGAPAAEEILAGRVANRIYEVTGAVVPLMKRKTIRQVCDARGARRRPLYMRLGFTPLLNPRTAG